STNKSIFSYDTSPSKLVFYVNNLGSASSESIYSDVVSISTNVWHHILLTRSDMNYSFYLDGTYVGGSVGSVALPNAEVPMYVGFSEGNSNSHFAGTMDEVRIYNRSMNSSEAQQQAYSSLNKYDVDNWQFFANETLTTFGNYSFYACANDTLGTENCTESRMNDFEFPSSYDVYFTDLTPPNNTNNFTYGLTFNITNNISREFASVGNTIEVDGTNYSCTLSSDSQSCYVTLNYSQHLFNHTYSAIGYGNLSGVVFNTTNETRVFDYYGCGVVNGNATLLGNVTRSSQTCFSLNSSNLDFNGADYTIDSVVGSHDPETYSIIEYGLSNISIHNVTIYRPNIAISLNDQNYNPTSDNITIYNVTVNGTASSGRSIYAFRITNSLFDNNSFVGTLVNSYLLRAGENITLSNTNASGFIDINYLGAAAPTNITITNNTLTSTNAGIYCGRLVNSTIFNNTLSGATEEITLGVGYGASGNLVANNTFFNYGGGFGGAAIHVYTSFNPDYLNIIENNTGINATGNQEQGIYIESSSNTVRNNIINNIKSGTSYIISGNSNQVYNNSASGTEGSLLALYGSSNTIGNMTLSNAPFGQGIYIQDPSNNLLDNINISNVSNGLYVARNSDSNNFSNIRILNSTSDAVRFTYFSSSYPENNLLFNISIFNSSKVVGYQDNTWTTGNNFTNLTACYNESVGCINWDFVNITYAKLGTVTVDDYTQNLYLQPDFVSLNDSESGASQFNSTANITLNASTCDASVLAVRKL
ncbi:right-handed parallel beta-helix repeat-containing protein, partial [Candidatus Micrarchaeota archaeon]|nr:right-handed parallel beta-helix repeat-containing protein [Candidatus Micrarchaeota archaeon]